MKEKEILNYIWRRWSGTDANWFNGNCYWFAHILQTRFPELRIYYFPIEGHFVAGLNNVFFDAAGEYAASGQPFYDFEELEKEDPSLYNRLIRDCVL